MADKKPPMPPKKPTASAKPAAKAPAKPAAPKMTDAQKYAALKRQTERAGMTVVERNGSINVFPKKK